MREEDPMAHLSGLCDICSVEPLNNGKITDNKQCPNCSANYTLTSFGAQHDDVSDRQLRVYLAHKMMNMYD